MLVSSRFAIEARYGLGLPIAGIYSGNLDNGGERITLVSSDGRTELINFAYDDKSPWPEEADGRGRSLVFAGAPKSQITPSSWSASAEAGGNPGRVN